MKIKDLLAYEAIDVQASASTKEEIINKAIDLMVKSGKINNREAYAKKVFEREEESTTGVGMGIAIPHGRDAAVSKAGLAAMVIPDGVEYASLDGQPVHLLFLIAAPEGGSVHLEVLAKLSRMLMDETLNANLQNAKSADEFLQILTDAETALEGPAEEETTPVNTNAPLILGVWLHAYGSPWRYPRCSDHWQPTDVYRCFNCRHNRWRFDSWLLQEENCSKNCRGS